MKENNSINDDHAYYSNLISNSNYDKDDFITFQLNSNTINLYYSKFVKYSKHIRDSYLSSDIIKLIPQELVSFLQKYDIKTDNILYFFQLLQQNLSIDKNNEEIYYKQYIKIF